MLARFGSELFNYSAGLLGRAAGLLMWCRIVEARVDNRACSGFWRATVWPHSVVWAVERWVWSSAAADAPRRLQCGESRVVWPRWVGSLNVAV